VIKMTCSTEAENTSMRKTLQEFFDANNPSLKPTPKYTELNKATLIYIENELSDELDSYCKGRKGMKSKITNDALKFYFNAVKNNKLK
jgi:hypothetical protein